LQTAVDLYRNWAVSRYFNGIAAALAAAVDREVHPGETLRVLEIGGGTGGTTAAVLPALSSQRTRYCFTDVSEFFFAAAAEDFSAYPFVEYAVLDMERDPDVQGFGRHAFHAVVAANVLHATRDLAATVDRVLSLLQPGGLLILYEVTAPKPWLDTSVALIAGWAESTDGLRDDGPLLAAATWRDLLLRRGFVDVAVFPSADSSAAILGMSVIAARAPAAAVDAVVPQTPGVVAARGDAAPVSALQESFATALPNERRDLLVDFVREHVAAVLRRDPALGPIGRQQSLMDLGLDSLMAVELRNRLTRGLALERTLPVSLIFDYPHIEAIADYLVDILSASDAPAAASETPIAAAAGAITDISALSDEAIEALLLKKLDGGSRD
jgi:SAM-dependent methyltransferase